MGLKSTRAQLAPEVALGFRPMKAQSPSSSGGRGGGEGDGGVPGGGGGGIGGDGGTDTTVNPVGMPPVGRVSEPAQLAGVAIADTRAAAVPVFVPTYVQYVLSPFTFAMKPASPCDASDWEPPVCVVSNPQRKFGLSRVPWMTYTSLRLTKADPSSVDSENELPGVSVEGTCTLVYAKPSVRGPQSVQSVPREQCEEYSAPGPPSEQKPSLI
jgi:hypothetical protein